MMSSNTDANKRSHKVGRNVKFEPVLCVLYVSCFRALDLSPSGKVAHRARPFGQTYHLETDPSARQSLRLWRLIFTKFLEEAVQICILRFLISSTEKKLFALLGDPQSTLIQAYYGSWKLSSGV